MRDSSGSSRERSERLAGALLILPPGAGEPDSVSPATHIAGLPLLRRIVLAAMEAGFGQVLLHPAAAPDDRSLLRGTTATLLAPPTGLLPPLPPRRIVLLATNVLPTAQWLRSLLEMPTEPEWLYTDGSSAAVIETGDPALVLAEAARCNGARELWAFLSKAFTTGDRPLGGEGRFPLTPAAVRHAEDWLLRGLVREAEGFMSRHVERRISLALTRRLAATRITPNAMTLVSLGVGLLGAPFFLSPAPAYQLTGALLLLAHSILDGCDGELARLKFQESRLGSLLDFWGDNVVHVGVMACIAIGWSLAGHTAWPLLIGGVAAGSVLLAAAFVYRRTRQEKALAGRLFPSGSRRRARWLPRLVDMLARRDFIYLVVLLAAAGKATWFLALAAVGTPVFVLLLAWIDRTERRRVPS